MNPQQSCPNCGAPIEVERKGHIEVIRCSTCPWEIMGTVFPAEEVASLAAPEVVRVRLAWHEGRVTAKQVLAAKKIAPGLKDKPIGAILQECADSTTYDIGSYPEPVANRLQEKAEQLGLKLIIEPPTHGA